MKTLVILAHPNIDESKANKRWKEELLKYPEEIEIHELYKEYPDWNIDVKREQELLRQYGHIILQFPLYWFNCPPLLKKWLDDVFEYNWAYGPQGDKLKGKKIGLAVTTGGKKEYYAHGGRNKFALDEIFIPFEQVINYVQGVYLPYFSVYGVSPLINDLDENGFDKNSKEYIEYIRKTRNKLFIANLKYKKSMEEVNKVLEEHLEYLDKYFEKGNFICTGKKEFPEAGGIILLNADDLEVARKILFEDLFYTEEIADFEIIEFQTNKYNEKFSSFVISKK